MSSVFLMTVRIGGRLKSVKGSFYIGSDVVITFAHDSLSLLPPEVLVSKVKPCVTLLMNQNESRFLKLRDHRRRVQGIVGG